MRTPRISRKIHRGPDQDQHSEQVLEVARRQESVMSRRQLYSLGVTRWEVSAHLRAERWQRVTDQVVALHTGPLTDTALLWAAVLQGGPRAQLDGVSALIAAGLQRFRADRHRVSVPRGARVRRTARIDVRQTRRWSAEDRVSGGGPPRTRPAVAAVRAGLWARTAREATYLLTLAVQQGLASPEEIGLELLRVRRARHRTLLHTVVNDLLDGARALGEIDVVRELRRRGLPPPRHQSVRRDRRGRYYLDLHWPDLGLVVEVDGIHHTWVENVVADALRQNALTLAHDVVLRLPLLGLRLRPDDFFDQIATAIRQAQSQRLAG